MQETTSEEKLDYIYTRLKKQEKSEKIWMFLKWGFRIFIVWYLYYFMTVWLPLLIDKMIPDIPSFSGQESGSQINTDQIQDLIGEYFSK